MVVKFRKKNGGVMHGPPYTKEEEAVTSTVGLALLLGFTEVAV
jgi:hypothetical protein